METVVCGVCFVILYFIPFVVIYVLYFRLQVPAYVLGWDSRISSRWSPPPP